MARMNLQEIEAAVARARHEGAREIAELIDRMRELGLSLAAVSGALEATVSELSRHAEDAASKAEESRAAKAEPKTPAQQPLE